MAHRLSTRQLLLIILLILAFSGCSDNPLPKEPRPELLCYCGITMVDPIRKIADLVEKEQNCKIKVIKEGSGNLYRILSINKTGDLFLPGSESYINKGLQEGIVLDTVEVGFNKAAFVVAKNNPLGISGDIENVIDSKYRVVLGNPDSGSIGKETKHILQQTGIYKKAMSNVTYLTTDSKDLTKAIIENTADLVINWQATAKWSQNRDNLTVIPIDNKYAPERKLVLGLLSYSRHTDIARGFLEYAVSEEGRKLFQQYGFSDGIREQ
jgi:molybdate transport system substrate-binding protein